MTVCDSDLENHRKETTMADGIKGPEPRSAASPGLAVIGCILVGISGLVAFMVAAAEHADYVGAGVCLIASALAFGSLANAVFRK